MSVIGALNIRYIKATLDAMDRALVDLPDTSDAVIPGTYLRTITSNKIKRKYIVTIPGNHNGTVIINMHGGGGRAQTARLQSLMDQYTGPNRFVAVYPDGIGKVVYSHRLLQYYPGQEYTDFFHKVAIDDVQFVRDIVDDLGNFFDVSRVYATGLSNGSMMAYRLACDMSDILSGVACLSATMLRSNEPKGRIPVLHIHGMKDLNAPYNGGHGLFAIVPIDHVSAQENILKWANHDGCSLDPEVVEYGNYTIYTYTAEGWGGAVKLIKVDDLGHGWPGGTQMLSSLIEGNIYNNINACEEMLSFFKKHCGMEK